MSKSIGRVFGTGSMSPYGYETDYMQYLQGYNPYNYEQTLQNMMPSAVNVNVQPDYQLSVQNSTSQSEETTDTFSEKPEEADARLRRMLNKIIDNVNQMNAYKESLYQPYNGYDRNTNAYTYTPQLPETQQTTYNQYPYCYVEFDGSNVDLYKFGQNIDNRLQNGQLQYNLDGQSGRDDHQSGIHQDVPNKGPIPEGTYYADQDQRQSLTLKNIALKLGEKLGFNMNQKSSWSGNPISWGTKRVWLRPDANTNTYGRSGFTIHGGLTKGSAGCIDIPWQTGKLSDYLDGCQDSVPVYVKYPKDW